MIEDFALPKRLVDDIVAVQRHKKLDFDAVKVEGDVVLLMKGNDVVFKHRVICPGNY
jgi:hypothetical protein